MIIYNVTVSIQHNLLKEWLEWMTNTHIPEVMRTNFFISAQLKRVIINNDSGCTYAVAYTCHSLKDLQKYESTFAVNLQEKYKTQFGENAPSFRTIMSIEKEF